MNTHSIDLVDYRAQSRGNSILYLGTAGSHGNEQLQVTQGKGWEGLTVQVVFHPCKVAVQLPANGVLDVPWEATARPLTAMQGRIVFQGFDQDRLVNSTDLAYTVASHSPTLGRDEQPYTPGIVEGVLNQMAADKDAILQAAQQTGQAKEAAAASAAEAASSAANAQQSAGAANTSVGQAAASASQAAGSAAAANETLTQVQTAGQEAQQKVKDAETEALGNISAAAPALPAVSAAAAWQSVTAKPDGTGYNLAAMAPIEATIRPTVTGNPAVCKDSAAWAFQGLAIYGKSTQDGTPSPENPVPIVSAGDGGSIAFGTSLNLFDVNHAKSGFISDKGNISSNTSWVYNDEIPCLFHSIIVCKDTNSYLSVRIATYSSSGFQSVINKNNMYNKSYKVDIPNGTKKIKISWSIKASEKDLDLTGLRAFWGDKDLGDKTYQPPQSITISTPNGLPGIPVDSGGNYTDSTGQQWACDEVDFESWKYTQNCAKFIFDGSEDEEYHELDTGDQDIVRFNITIPGNKILQSDTTNGVTSINSNFKISTLGSTYSEANVYTVSNDDYSSLNISFFKSQIASVSDLKMYLQQNPMTLIGALETPVKFDLSGDELAAYRALTTYDGTTVVSTAEPVAGIEASYVMDGTAFYKKLAPLLMQNKTYASYEDLSGAIREDVNTTE